MEDNSGDSSGQIIKSGVHHLDRVVVTVLGSEDGVLLVLQRQEGGLVLVVADIRQHELRSHPAVRRKSDRL